MAKPVARPKPAPIRIVPPPEQSALPQIETALTPPERISPTGARAENLILRALKAAGLIPKR
jgi:hypothetical protein